MANIHNISSMKSQNMTSDVAVKATNGSSVG